MDVNGGGERLACGREIGPLVDQVVEGAPRRERGHQEQCPHCQATLGELERLWSDVRELALETVAVPDRIAHNVIERIRRERPRRVPPTLALERVVPRLVRHALLQGERGSTQIADSVIAKLARRLAMTTPGVHAVRRAGSAARVGGWSADVAVTVAGSRAAAQLSLVIEYGARAPSVIDAVRERVIRGLEETTGLQVAAVDIAVVDVHFDG